MEESLTVSGPFVLLAFAISSVWLTSTRNRNFNVPLWIWLFSASLLFGLYSGVFNYVAVTAMLVFGGVCYLASGKHNVGGNHYVASLVTAILALVLAMHRLPGFHNPIIIDSMVLSPGAAPFTQYANYDKGAVGLILLAVMCLRSTSIGEAWRVIKKIIPVAIVTTIGVMLAAFFAGYVRLDFKLSQTTLLFVSANLFFTVVAEEAFFRGLIQTRLGDALRKFRYGPLITVLCSGLLFGVAHAAGGTTYMLLASLAGIGYAYAYATTRRIEAPIFCHWFLNTVHFIFFTYPNIA